MDLVSAVRVMGWLADFWHSVREHRAGREVVRVLRGTREGLAARLRAVLSIFSRVRFGVGRGDYDS